MSVTACG